MSWFSELIANDPTLRDKVQQHYQQTGTMPPPAVAQSLGLVGQSPQNRAGGLMASFVNRSAPLNAPAGQIPATGANYGSNQPPASVSFGAPSPGGQAIGAVAAGPYNNTAAQQPAMGQQPSQVQMRAPDGSTQMVPAEHVGHYRAKGAQVMN